MSSTLLSTKIFVAIKIATISSDKHSIIFYCFKNSLSVAFFYLFELHFYHPFFSSRLIQCAHGKIKKKIALEASEKLSIKKKSEVALAYCMLAISLNCQRECSSGEIKAMMTRKRECRKARENNNNRNISAFAKL